MKFSVHGSYTIQKENHYFIINLYGALNAELAKILSNDFKMAIKDSGYKQYGVIIDLSQWEGSTPEALYISKTILDYLFENGQILGVRIYDSWLGKIFSEPLYQLQALRMECAQFDTLDNGITWMEKNIETYLPSS